MLYDITWFGSD